MVADNSKILRERQKQTLEQRYPIRYRQSYRVPVQLIIRGNTLRIRFFVHYSRRFLHFFPGSDISYADIFEASVRSNWSGKFVLPWLADDGYERAKARASFRVLTNDNHPPSQSIQPDPAAIRVAIEFIRKKSKEARVNYPRQRFFKVRFSSFKHMPSHVISSPWRWFWGVFRSAEVEALQLNWSINHPGNIIMQKGLSRRSFQQTSAHEIGHLLGIGDAYGANYRFFYEAPGTSHYMMCHNKRVQPEEIEMAINAHFWGKMQYFPKKIIPRVIFVGFRRALRIKMNALSKDDKKQAQVAKESQKTKKSY